MEGKSFAKMCKDTKIIDKKLDGTNVDLIFAKSKDKSERRINFDQFFYALNLCAQKKGVAEQDLYSAIAASSTGLTPMSAAGRSTASTAAMCSTSPTK